MRGVRRRRGRGGREGEGDFYGLFGGRGGPDGILLQIVIPSHDLPKSQRPQQKKKREKMREEEKKH